MEGGGWAVCNVSDEWCRVMFHESIEVHRHRAHLLVGVCGRSWPESRGIDVHEVSIPREGSGGVAPGNLGRIGWRSGGRGEGEEEGAVDARRPRWDGGSAAGVGEYVVGVSVHF